MSSSKRDLFTSPVASGKKRRHGEETAICRSAKKRKTLEQLGDLTVVTHGLGKDEKRMNKAIALKANQNEKRMNKAIALKANQKKFKTLLESTKKDQKKAGKDWELPTNHSDGMRKSSAKRTVITNISTSEMMQST
jgi:hypothetical protein